MSDAKKPGVPQVDLGMNSSAQSVVPKSPIVIPAQPSYKPRLKGIEVAPGEDWRHTTNDQRQNWFRNLENFWKQRMNTASGGMQTNMNWTRG